MSRADRHRLWMRAAIVVGEAEVSHAHSVVASYAAQADEARADAVVYRARARLREAFEATISRPANAVAIADHMRHAAWLDEQIAFYESARHEALKRVGERIQELAEARRQYREDLAFARRIRHALRAP